MRLWYIVDVLALAVSAFLAQYRVFDESAVRTRRKSCRVRAQLVHTKTTARLFQYALSFLLFFIFTFFFFFFPLFICKPPRHCGALVCLDDAVLDLQGDDEFGRHFQHGRHAGGSASEIRIRPVLLLCFLVMNSTVAAAAVSSSDTIPIPIANQVGNGTTAAELRSCTIGGCCGKRTPLLDPSAVAARLPSIPAWHLLEGGTRIRKEFVAKNWQAAMDWINKVSVIAEDEGHHPDLHLTNWRHVRIEMWTHAIGGLSLPDFVMAAKIDAVEVQLSPKWIKEQQAADIAASAASASDAGCHGAEADASTAAAKGTARMSATCLHKTVLLGNLKKKFLNAKPGQAGPRAAIVKQLGGISPVANCVVFYRSRTALVEFESAEDADKVLRHFAEVETAAATNEGAAFGSGETSAPLSMLVLGSDRVTMMPGEQPFKPERAASSRTDPATVAKACSNCIANLLKQVQKREDEENRIRRKLEQQRHRQLLRELAKQTAAQLLAVARAAGTDADASAGSAGTGGGGIRTDVCYDFVKRGGRAGACSRGDACNFKHELVPLHQIPAALRHYTIRDSFPEARESHAEKLAVNAALATAASHIENPKCIVLDGAGCGTTVALQDLCTAHSRTPQDIVVPNSCTETYLSIHNSGKCLAYHGSLRAYLDENAAVRLRTKGAALKGEAKAPQLAKHFRPSIFLTFGLAYLDYCSTLYAGFEDVEKAPKEDVRTLFKSGALDPAGAVLAVTLAYPTGATAAAGTTADGEQDLHGRHSKDAAQQERDLRELLAEAATSSQRAIVSLKRFEYERTGIYIFLTYHSSEEEGVAVCRERCQPLEVADAIAAAASNGAARLVVLLQRFL